MLNNPRSEQSSPSMNTLRDIPTPKPDAQPITGLIKKGGRVTGYQLADGRILDKAEGIRLAKDGGIQGVGIATRNGNEYLKSLPDGSSSNNLSSLPTVPLM
ncbi:MAG TPA: DUF3892 domain-containing protein [Clostridia bacterium]|nr:DUF3892 domain-containing protein [Clostridia bacterium]